MLRAKSRRHPSEERAHWKTLLGVHVVFLFTWIESCAGAPYAGHAAGGVCDVRPGDPCTNSDHAVDSSDCSQYYVCEDRLWVISHCANFTQYNPLSGTCVSDVTTDCLEYCQSLEDQKESLLIRTLSTRPLIFQEKTEQFTTPSTLSSQAGTNLELPVFVSGELTSRGNISNTAQPFEQRNGVTVSTANQSYISSNKQGLGSISSSSDIDLLPYSTPSEGSSGGEAERETPAKRPTDWEKLTEAPTQGEKNTEAPTEGKKLIESPTQGRKHTEAHTEASTVGEKLTEAPTEGEKLTEAPTQGEKLTEAPTQGRKHTEAPTQGEKLTEAPTQGRKHTEAHTEASTEGEKLTEAPIQGRKPTEAPIQGKKPTEAPTEGGKLTETPTEGATLAKVLTEEELSSETTDFPELITYIVITRRGEDNKITMATPDAGDEKAVPTTTAKSLSSADATVQVEVVEDKNTSKLLTEASETKLELTTEVKSSTTTTTTTTTAPKQIVVTTQESRDTTTRKQTEPPTTTPAIVEPVKTTEPPYVVVTGGNELTTSKASNGTSPVPPVSASSATAAIVGGIVAGLVVLIVVILLLIFLHRRRSNRKHQAITRVDNPKYKGAAKDYRFSRDTPLVVNNTVNLASYKPGPPVSESPSTAERRKRSAPLPPSTRHVLFKSSSKRKAPVPPNPFGDDDDYYEKDSHTSKEDLELTTFRNDNAEEEAKVTDPLVKKNGSVETGGAAGSSSSSSSSEDESSNADTQAMIDDKKKSGTAGTLDEYDKTKNPFFD